MQIYKITNLINNKIYIGKDESNRKNYFGSGKLIKRSLKKYGKENHKKEILEEVNNKEKLIELEKYWIKKLKSYDKDIGYNISMGGDGGNTMSNNPNLEEIKKKISNTLKGRIFSEEHKLKIRENHNSKNPLVREKLSKALKGRKKSKEAIEKQKAAMLGRKPPQHVLDTLIKANKYSVWYHNPKTEELIRIKQGETIPNGFVKGKGKKYSDIATNFQKGRKYNFYHNPLTMQQKRIYEDQTPPKDWVKGVCRQRKVKPRIKIAQHSLEGELIKIHEGCVNASKEMGVSDSCIVAAYTGKQKTSCGFIWKKL